MKGKTLYINLFFAILLIATFINSSVFGSETLSSFFYFSYSFLSVFIITLIIGLVSNKILVIITPSITLWFVLTITLVAATYLNYIQNIFLIYFVVISLFYFFIVQICSNYKRYLNYNTLHQIIVGATLLQCIIVFLQYFNIINSGNKYFSATGTWQNPNIIASFVAYSFVSFYFSGLKIFLKVSFALVAVLALFILDSRTGYLVLFSIFLIIAINQLLNSSLYKKWKMPLIVLLCLMSILFASFFYYKEVHSNSTRLTIAANSLKISKENNFLGYGLGSFESTYNRYLINNYNQNNQYVSGANNDFIQLLIEGGLLSLLCYIGFLIFLMYYGLSDIDNHKKALLTFPFIMIQILNYGFQNIPTTFLFITYIGLYATQRNLLKTKISTKLVSIVLILLAIFTFYNLYLMGKTYAKLNTLSKSTSKDYSKKITDIEKLPYKTNWYYYSSLAAQYENTNDYKKANDIYKLAFKTNVKPELLSRLSRNYLFIHDTINAKKILEYGENLEPLKIMPLMNSLIFYKIVKDSVQFIRKAHQIIKREKSTYNENTLRQIQKAKLMKEYIIKNGMSK